jgi:hypothetical protein
MPVQSQFWIVPASEPTIREFDPLNFDWLTLSLTLSQYPPVRYHEICRSNRPDLPHSKVILSLSLTFYLKVVHKLFCCSQVIGNEFLCGRFYIGQPDITPLVYHLCETRALCVPLLNISGTQSYRNKAYQNATRPSAMLSS